jgi:2-octaprenyl-6-methoxyphenol hydroxylase
MDMETRPLPPRNERESKPVPGQDASRLDAAIVGGGIVGQTLAVALADAGFAVAIFDRDAPAKQLDVGFDGRASAVALGSQRILESLGVWADIAAAAGPIRDIRVSDGPSRLFLHYDHRAAGERAADGSAAPLGFIVENRTLRQALATALAARPAIALHAPAAVASIAVEPAGAVVTLESGAQYRAGLVIGADGRGSVVRRAAGIATAAWDYPQTAIVTAVRHAVPHRGIAHERFLPAGPFALLPLKDPTLSSVVWTERRDLVQSLLALDDRTLGAEMTERFGPSLGPLALEGPRWTWPLKLHHAARYAAPRLVLAGDAAHGIHPIAGQGLNLGWRDVAALAEVLVDARRLGQDIGTLDVLGRYEAWRRPDTLALVMATDGLNRLFGNDLAPIRLARDLGLGVVNRLPGLKRVLMRQAMGLNGNLPRLARGLPL